LRPLHHFVVPLPRAEAGEDFFNSCPAQRERGTAALQARGWKGRVAESLWSADVLEGPVRLALCERLATASRAPIVVAVSGGSDSLALLLIAKAWADQTGRRLVAVTIDHRLQPEGARWARFAKLRAERLGVEHCILSWDADKPLAGIAAAARAARHGLLADEARRIGARVILMGHTADDCLEAAAMRAAGEHTPTPRPWAPSPIWPGGRGLFILRPLLGARRADLQAMLSQRGERWIDDPANADPRHPRARARARAMLSVGAIEHGWGDAGPDEVQIRVREGPAGELCVRQDQLQTLSCANQRRFIGAALLCASGGERPPRGAAVDRLASRIGAGQEFSANLAGARVESDGAQLRFMREPGDMQRSGVTPAQLPVGVQVVWDGRYQLTARVQGLTARALGGVAARLPRVQRNAVKRSSPAARRALCIVIDGDGQASCPTLADDSRIEVRSLVAERLAGALGAVRNETAIGRVAEAPGAPYMEVH